MIRSAKLTESASSDPPKPRLSTGSPGKSSLSVDHMRILELPTNTMQSLGGGFVRSLASKAAISDSHFVEFCCATVFGGNWTASTKVDPRNKKSARERTAIGRGKGIFIFKQALSL